MYAELSTKTTLLLIISMLCSVGVFLPFPLAPFTFAGSIWVLTLARAEYQRGFEEAYPSDIILKLGVAMVVCVGNILATILFCAVMIFSLILVIPSLSKYSETSKSIDEHKINIENVEKLYYER